MNLKVKTGPVLSAMSRITNVSRSFLLLLLLLSAVLFTPTLAAVDPSGLLFWHRMESAGSAETGQAMTWPGTPGFEPAKFGNGAYSNPDGWTYTPGTNIWDDISIKKGCIEFWFKYKYDGWTGYFSTYLCRYLGLAGIVIRTDTGGLTLYTNWGPSITKPYTPVAGELHHVAYSWDKDGINGTGKYQIFYWDGSEIASDTTPIDPYMVHRGDIYDNFIINSYGGGDFSTQYAMDNIKIWNYAKTDFSDRFSEGPSYNTPVGITVEVQLVGITTTFSQVTSAGNTTATVTDTGPAIPGTLKLLGKYYDISTTATYNGTITASIHYDDTGLTPAKEQKLKLQQYVDGKWVNITTSLDTANNIITGETTHFCYFAVMEPLDTTPPSVTITSPQAQTYFNTQRTLTIEYTVQDNMDPSPAITNAMLDGDFLDMQNNPSIDLTQMALGQHMLTIEATDASGNVGQGTVIFEVKMAPLSSFMIKNLQISFKPETREHRARADKITIAGKLDLPSPYTTADILSDVTVMLEVGSSSGTDTVLAKTHKQRWEYKRKKFEVPADTNLDIKRLKIKWAGKEGSMDTFKIEGYMDAENDDSGNVTLTLVMPLKAGGDLSGTQTVTCKTSKRSWEYNTK